MYRPKRIAGVIFGATVLVSLILGGSALAKEKESVELDLTPLSDSGVSGTAILTNDESGVQVKLDMQGLPEADVEHINHVHGGGTCADVQAGNMAPVTIPLKTIVANADGTGSATTTIKDVTLEKLLGDDQHRFILVHAKVKKGQGVPPGISCVDLPQQSTNTTFEDLPSSGGLPPLTLLVILLTIGVGAVLTIRRSIV